VERACGEVLPLKPALTVRAAADDPLRLRHAATTADGRDRIATACAGFSPPD